MLWNGRIEDDILVFIVSLCLYPCAQLILVRSRSKDGIAPLRKEVEHEGSLSLRVGDDEPVMGLYLFTHIIYKPLIYHRLPICV